MDVSNTRNGLNRSTQEGQDCQIALTLQSKTSSVKYWQDPNSWRCNCFWYGIKINTFLYNKQNSSHDKLPLQNVNQDTPCTHTHQIANVHFKHPIFSSFRISKYRAGGSLNIKPKTFFSSACRFRARRQKSIFTVKTHFVFKPVTSSKKKKDFCFQSHFCFLHGVYFKNSVLGLWRKKEKFYLFGSRTHFLSFWWFRAPRFRASVGMKPADFAKISRSCTSTIFLAQEVRIELIFALGATVFEIHAEFQNCHICARKLAIGSSLVNILSNSTHIFGVLTNYSTGVS